MALNPSDKLSEDPKCFSTLGDPPFPIKCKNHAVAELMSAGFPRSSVTLTAIEREVFKPDSQAAELARMGIVVPAISKDSEKTWITLYSILAELHKWKFRRAWYYWVAYTDDPLYAIPQGEAEFSNKEYRMSMRVDGHGDGQDVLGDVALYHVDTPRALDALTILIRDQHARVVDSRGW